MAAVNRFAEGRGKPHTEAGVSPSRLVITKSKMSAFTVTAEECHGGVNLNQDVILRNETQVSRNSCRHAQPLDTETQHCQLQSP